MTEPRSNTTSAASSEWAATRGEKWRDSLSGIEPMLAPVDLPLIEALRLDAPYRIADIGCGGGGTTLRIARSAPAGSVVHGFDISPALVEAARGRLVSGEHSVAFDVVDVSAAPAPERPFDRLTSRFGVMFFDDPPAAFARLRPWVAPGGRLAFAVWGRPNDNPWMTVVRDTAAEVVDVPPPDPEAPGPFRYAEVDKLLALLRGAGFDDTSANEWRGALPIGGAMSAGQAAAFALTSFGSFADLLAAAGDEATARVRQSLTARFARHEKEGAVWLEASVYIVVGSRSS